MRFLRLLFCASVASATLACSTTNVPLTYAASSAVTRADPAVPLVSVGPFQDGRNISYGSDWLGAIRGGYGNELKRLRTQKPMSEVVQEAFAEGLRARGVYAEAGQGRFTLAGTITKLDCSEYFNLEAHAHVEVVVSETESHAQVYTKAYQVDETEGGFGAGVFASVETLRVLAEKTLRELVDRALDDPELRKAVQSR